MTHVMALIAVLTSMNVHGSKVHCQKLIDSLVGMEVDEVLQLHSDDVDSDLHAIINFKDYCNAKGNTKNSQ